MHRKLHQEITSFESGAIIKTDGKILYVGRGVCVCVCVCVCVHARVQLCTWRFMCLCLGFQGIRYVNQALNNFRNICSLPDIIRKTE